MTTTTRHEEGRRLIDALVSLASGTDNAGEREAALTAARRRLARAGFDNATIEAIVRDALPSGQLGAAPPAKGHLRLVGGTAVEGAQDRKERKGRKGGGKRRRVPGTAIVRDPDPIVDWEEAPIYTTASRRVPRWRMGLASVAAEACGCKAYEQECEDGTTAVCLIGRRADAERARQLFGRLNTWLGRQAERKRRVEGRAPRWVRAYVNEAARAIGERLEPLAALHRPLTDDVERWLERAGDFDELEDERYLDEDAPRKNRDAAQAGRGDAETLDLFNEHRRLPAGE